MANILGRYILDRKIATGGMAEIWVGHQQGPAGFEKEVVIKKILPHLSEDPKFIDMFLDEARLAAKLSHPNIAQIFDLGSVDNDYFIAMEFIDGHDVQAIIDRASVVGCAFSPAVAARIVADACTALDYAHTFRDRDGTHVQLVHRDVSPQNILVSNDGIVKLVDFGVAKAATSSHKTQTGAVKGKLSYMSPEQISGKLVDARSDIFALGIVLYELVTGRRPFGHDSELLAITAILNEHPTRPRELIFDVPPELEAVILRALDKDPATRFQSASEMQLALEHVLRKMGAILTSREVRTYLEDLFSDSPTGALPAVAVGGIGGVTHVEHPSAATRPEFTGIPHPSGGAIGVSARPAANANMSDRVYLASAMPNAADEEEIIEAPRSKGPVIAALSIVLLLLAGGAFGLFMLFGPGSDDGRDDEDDSARAADDRDRDDEEEDENDDAEEDVAEASGDEVVDDDTILVADGDAGGKPEEQPLDQDAGSEASTDTEPSEEQGDATVAVLPDAEVVAEPDAALAEADAEENTVEADAEVAEPTDEENGNVEPETDQTETETETETETDPPERVERVREGTISIVVPGGSATMYIDGDRVGSYPGRTRFTVRAGSHRVRVDSADGESFSTTVDVDGGETERVRVRY